MLIQFILIAIIALIIMRLIYRLKIKDINLGQFYLWLAVWLVAIAIIWRPEATTYLALKVGIGRGTDLVVYVSVITLFYLMFKLLVRIGRLEKNITKLVRDDAIDQKR